MDRRTFIEKVAGSLLVAPLPAFGQQTEKVRRLGILATGTISSDWPMFSELRKLGWVEGQNLLIERRTGNAELVPGLAAELVQLRLDVIVTPGAVASLAAKSATTTVPLVTITGDPVRAELVASMSRPGGNITGTTTLSPELAAKRLELLREIVPTARRVGELVDPANRYFAIMRNDTELNYRTFGMEALFVNVVDATQLEGAIAEVARMRADALIVRSDSLFTSSRVPIADLALKHALPTMAEGTQFVEAGCLASYANSFSAMGRAVAGLVDKILKGAKPGDLPIVQPTEFDRAINLKTAKALGITISQSLRSRFNIVIE